MNLNTSRVGIVSVCYNSMAVLPDMLASVPKNIPVVLISNAGEDDNSPLAKLAELHDTTLIINKSNKGFGSACNQGADILKTELILFLNPDTILKPNAIYAMLAAVDPFPSAVAFNPRIISSSGTPFFKRKSHLLPPSMKMKRGWPKADCEVSILSGAAMLVKKSIFEEAGGFDPAIFLYHEDDDLSVRLSKKFGKLYFVRDALVMHLQGRSSARSPEVAALKAWHMGRSHVYVSHKHCRPMPFMRPLLKALFQLCSIQILISRRKRAKQRAYLKGVISARSFLDSEKKYE